MIRLVSGSLAIIVAALIVTCRADPHQEQDGSASEHGSADRFDSAGISKGELGNILRYLLRSEDVKRKPADSAFGRTLDGIGGGLLGRNLDGIGGGGGLLGRNLDGIGGGGGLLGRNLNGIGGGSLIGRNLHGIGGGMIGRNLDGIGGNILGKRFIDSIGGGNFVRNLDSIGGGNFVKRNLDQIGGPNLIRRTLDSIGGGNFVRNLDSLGGGNFVREVDSIGGGHKTRLDSLGGGNLVRQVRESRRPWVPYMIPRPIEYSSPFGLKRELWPVTPMEFGGYFGDGLPKRNFDEIDRSGLDNFVKKRNFDEIDHTNMPFPYAVKRFMHMMGHESNFEKRNPREYPMDEIDLSGFPIGSKRSFENYPLIPRVL